jgi:predicted nucleic acid-binding protein
VSAFVLDTSIALKWFLEDENDRAHSLAILRSLSDDYRPIVPWLWYYEMANVLLIQVHRKRIVFDEVKAFLSLIGEMTIDIDHPTSWPSSSFLTLLVSIASPATTQLSWSWRTVCNCHWPPAIRT